MKKYPVPFKSKASAPMPSDPFNNDQSQPQPEPDQGFNGFVDDLQTLDKIKNPNFPHKGAGVHIPFWLSPAAAKDVMARHGATGHAFPHPNMRMLNKK